MEHKSVDRIMEHVKRRYQGEFSVNGDWKYSQRLTKRYQERSRKHFNGRNGRFGLDHMLCTEDCVREGNALRVPAGGVVYGPYFAFAPGEYYAWFELSGELQGCALEVSSPKGGIVAAADVSEIEKNGQIVLEFSLAEAVEDLELKALNRGSGVICFKSVTVKDRPEESIGAQETQAVLNTGAGQVNLYDLEDALEEIETIQIELTSESRKNGRAAECALPADSRLRGVKKLIRKVINCFALFQVEFNRKTANCFTTVVRELQAIVEMVRQLAFTVGELNAKMGALSGQVEVQNRRLEAQKAERAADMDLFRKTEERAERAEAEAEDIRRQLIERMHLSAAEYSQSREERLERLEKKITELNEVFEQQSTCLEGDHAEIDHLWNKIREVDHEFWAVWQSCRDMNSNLNSVWSTYHAFRQEVFYEIDSRSRQNGCLNRDREPGWAAVNPIVKSTAKAKIERFGGKIRLNLGSGPREIDEYLSVDARELPGVDVVADVASLPYKEGTVDEIFSAHLIEHFTTAVMERELLPYWYSLLKSGGVFRVVFPDMDGIIQAYTKNEMSFEALAEVIMGGQDYQLDYHYAVYSPERVAEMLKRTGFRNVKIVARNRENGGCREAEVTAQK